MSYDFTTLRTRHVNLLLYCSSTLLLCCELLLYDYYAFICVLPRGCLSFVQIVFIAWLSSRT